MSDDQTFCITNHAEVMGHLHRSDRPYPCRRRGMTSAGERIPEAHYATCEDVSCRGCIPRSATHGYLCGPCYFQVKDALGRLAWLISHLRSIDRPATAIGERVDTSMTKSILMPDPWIAADELMQALGARVIPSSASIDEAIRLAHEAVFIDVDEWVNTIEGATWAVVLLRRMNTALRRWQDSEAQLRPIPGIRCPTCNEPHLMRRAPEQYGDDLLVICRTPECGFSLTWDAWTKLYAPAIQWFAEDMKRREKQARKEKRDA